MNKYQCPHCQFIIEQDKLLSDKSCNSCGWKIIVPMKKYECPDCNWIGTQDELWYEDYPEFYRCPSCGNCKYLEDFILLDDINEQP